ncbi:MAG: hypothetical protein ACQES8_03480 [Thermodesulfobacteriota bacterium]
MRILHLYYTSTGNTKKVAETIDKTLEDLGHELESIAVDKNTDADGIDGGWGTPLTY